ncbi:phosphotransacetylase family protein [Methanosalsum natronophilum]|uniref:phosphotransacetylase family protein n=1 Tax=Methanosalsum natronophilum TaxID=768733 RepID=UPI00216A681E|nr:phosphotransacetylase family protein [Methanosalsum natronophilum]MCS3924155.1 BioD-like phosphotransacetylase family protein [Methanosalsum natronophilum]
MVSVLVSSSEEYSGKSSLCAGLGILLKNMGYSVGYMKPIGNILIDVDGTLSDQDSEEIMSILDIKEDRKYVTPILLTDQLISDSLKGIDKGLDKRLKEAHELISKNKDIVLIEGTGDVGGGSMYGLSDPQVADILNAKMILVTRYNSIFAVDRILCDQKLIKNKDNLLGVILNEIHESDIDYVNDLVVPFLQSKNIRVFGTIQIDSTLRSIPISDIVEHLHAEVLTSAHKLELLVDNYLVGAMEVSAAIKYFRRFPNSVVITGGDRASIQLAAIEAKTKCLILTGGLVPGEAVLASAEEAEVPLLMVRNDTMSTIERIEELIGHARIKQNDKLKRTVELVDNNIDLDLILSELDLKKHVK